MMNLYEPKKKRLELSLEEISRALSFPRLEISRKKHLPLLLGSFTGSLGIIATLCGCLASLIVTFTMAKNSAIESEQIIEITAVTSSDPPVSTEDDKTPKMPRPCLHSPPVAPSSKPLFPTPFVKHQPQAIEVPDSEIKAPGFFDLEEIDYDDSFAPDPPKKQRVEISKPSKNSKTVASRRAETQKKQQAARKAALAKKMAQGPAVISRASPSYPRSARRRGIEGKVIITVSIGSNGRVVSCSVSQSSGDGSLDQAALVAARKFRFRPAENGLGQEMSSLKKIPFLFRLN